MVNVSAYPVLVDGRRLDDLAIGLEASSLTLGGLRSADQVLAGLDGEVASTTDSREPGAFALSCLVKGTDKDGLVPAGADAQATYQRNLETLKHLLCKTGTLLDVQRVTDKANSAILGTGGRTNLHTNPTWRTVSSLTEVRRNYVEDPHCTNAAKWGGYVAVPAGNISAAAAGAYSGSTGLVVTVDGTSVYPRIYAPGQNITASVGEYVTLQAKVRVGSGAWVNPTPGLLLRGPLSAGGEWTVGNSVATPLAGGWYLVTISAIVPSGATGAIVLNIGVNSGGAPAGATFHVDEVQVEFAEVALPFFSGLSAAADGLTYSWVGAAHGSASIAQGAAGGAGSPFQNYTGQPGVVGWTNGDKFRILLKRAVGVGGIIAFSAVGGQPPVAVGERRAGRFTVQQIGGSGTVNIGPRIFTYNSSPVTATDWLAGVPGDTMAVAPNAVVDAAVGQATGTVAASTVDGTSRWLIYARVAALPAGTTLEFTRAIMTASATAPPAYYDGNSAQSGWTGTPDQSTSVQDSADVRASAKVVDSITPEDAPGDYGRLTAVLKIVHAYWRGVTSLTWVRQSLTSGQAMEVTSLEGSSAPIGDAVYCLTGPANAGVQIFDVATNTFVRLNEALPAGSVWRVNADTWESRVAAGLTVDSPDTAGVDKAGVTDQSGTYPRFLRLHPRDDGTGRRVVKVSVVGTGFTSATSLTIKARGAHL